MRTVLWEDKGTEYLSWKAAQSMAYDYEKERREAIAAGNEALADLRETMNCLNSARNWGIYDILGGGLISSLIKHRRMGKAQQYISNAKNSLRHFREELCDLGRLDSINLDTQDFWGFADVAFDGFLADAAMLSRINEARADLSRAIEQVESILRKLQYPLLP